VLLSLAIALAESEGFARIVTGINQDAATAYPDNDEEWLNRFQHLLPFALGTDRSLKLDAPLRTMSKVEIVQHGEGLKIPWSQIPSWSCYNGGHVHCGLCSSCRARRRAFTLAKVKDPTEYEQ
jgi:7-cyano-7-deazaguanine synthase